MLSKKYVLRRRQDFVLCYQQKPFVSRYFLLFLRENTSSLSRIGITATKKLGNAVVRNRFKRVVRAFFARYFFYIKGAYDIVVVPRPALLYEKMSLPYEEKELQYLLRKAGILDTVQKMWVIVGQNNGRCKGNIC